MPELIPAAPGLRAYQCCEHCPDDYHDEHLEPCEQGCNDGTVVRRDSDTLHEFQLMLNGWDNYLADQDEAAIEDRYNRGVRACADQLREAIVRARGREMEF